MRATPYSRKRVLLTGAGNGQSVLAAPAAGYTREIKFIQVSADADCVVELYTGSAGSADADTAMGPGHIPATGGSNIGWNGHGIQTDDEIKADVSGSPTSVRIYVVYEDFKP